MTSRILGPLLSTIRPQNGAVPYTPTVNVLQRRVTRRAVNTNHSPTIPLCSFPYVRGAIVQRAGVHTLGGIQLFKTLVEAEAIKRT